MRAELQVKAINATEGVLFLVLYNPEFNTTSIRPIGQVIFPENDWIASSNRTVYSNAS